MTILKGCLISLAGLEVILAAHLSPVYLAPDDAGVINVRSEPFFAKGDGTADDTGALQAAFRHAIDRQDRYSSPPFVYIPEGTYLISDTLVGRLAPGSWADGWRAGLLIMGAGPGRAVIRLRNHAPGFQDPSKPRPMFINGSESDGTHNPDGGGNRAFRHALIGLTFHTGDGNPGAIGIDFVANNRGAIEDVEIVCGDTGGVTGLRLDRHWPGPALVKRLRVVGFDHGITLRRHWQYSMTFEHIELEGQRSVGLLTDNNPVFIRGLTSRNAVPAVRVTGEGGRLVMIGSRLLGGAPEASAIVNRGKVLLRDLEVEGYRLAVEDQTRNVQLTDRRISVYATDHFSLQAPPPPPLCLPIEETPEFHSQRLEDWCSVVAMGATPDHATDDDGPAIQRAIDSGRPIVYLPRGAYHVRSPVVIRGTTRKIMGFQSSLGAVKGVEVVPLLRFEGAGDEVTILEHLWLNGVVEHAGAGTFVIRHCDLRKGYRNTSAGRGKLFVEDVIGRFVIAHPQRAWFRQLNTEFGDVPLFENHGGTVWILGFKTEGEMVCIHQTAGQLELMGALLYPLRPPPADRAAFVLDGGEATLSYRMNGSDYPIHVAYRAGETLASFRKGSGQRHGPALFTADSKTAVSTKKNDGEILFVPFREETQIQSRVLIPTRNLRRGRSTF